MTAPPGVPTLRPFQAGDGPAVQQLHARSFAALAAGSYPKAEIDAYVRTLLEPGYVEEVAACHLAVLVGPDDEPVATAGWSPHPGAAGTARIRKVFVDPRRVRRGLASTLVADAEDRARAAGYRRFVLRANLNAVPLYLRLGYTADDEDRMPAAGEVFLPVRWMSKR